ncbi:MAG: aldehyde dehydrogenase family protein, partial [Deltaproteobacteria bacterium]
MTAPTYLRNFIGGDWRESNSDSWIADINPSNADDVVGHVPAGTVDDARAAVSSASTAYPAWRTLPGPARAEFLYKWAATIAARQEELAQLVTREVGKPIGESRGEVARCGMILRYYAG